MFTLPGKFTALWSRAVQSGGTQCVAGTTAYCGNRSIALAKGVLPNNKKRQSGNVCFPPELLSAPDIAFSKPAFRVIAAPSCLLSLQCLQRNAFSSEMVLIVCFPWQKMYALLGHDSSYLLLLEEKDYFLVR